MATTGNESFAGSLDEDISAINFEEAVKERLNWTRKKWESKFEANTKMKSLCSSLVYWVKKLKPAIGKTNVIVTLFNFKKDVKVQLLELVDALYNLERKVDLIGFSEFRNPRYLSLHFSDEETKKYVEKNLCKINDSYVVYLSWGLAPAMKVVKVHWLSMELETDIIKKQLGKYFVFKEHKQDCLYLMSGEKLTSGKVTFKAYMKEGVEIDEVPHLMYINGMETLITIQGRSPLCLTCDKVGHIAKDCPTPFCRLCKRLRDRQHICDKIENRSYAAAVENKDATAGLEEGELEVLEEYQKLIDKDNEEKDDKLMSTNKLERKNKRIYEHTDDSKKEIIGLSAKNDNVASVDMQTLIKEGSGSKEAENEVKFKDGEFEDDSDESENDTSSLVAVKNLEQYLQELNRFKAEPLGEGGGGPKSNVNIESTEDNDSARSMDLDAQSLKRKIKVSEVKIEGKEGTSLPTNSGWIKVYGRGRRGRRATRGCSAFDEALAEKVFVFHD